MPIVDICLEIVDAQGHRHLWPIGPVDSKTVDDLIARARISLGIGPPTGSPFDGSPYAAIHDSALYPNNPGFAATATMHQPGELDTVTAHALAGYRTQEQAVTRQRQLDTTRAAIAALHPEDKATLTAETTPTIGRK